jgi:hypothetical protein
MYQIRKYLRGFASPILLWCTTIAMLSLPEAAFWHWNITHRRFLHELLKEFLDLRGYWGVLGVVPMYTKTRNVCLLYQLIEWMWPFFSLYSSGFFIGSQNAYLGMMNVGRSFLPFFVFIYDACIIMIGSASKLVFPSAHVYIWWQINLYGSLSLNESRWLPVSFFFFWSLAGFLWYDVGERVTI